MTLPIISADSHVTEPPNTYVDYIDAAWRAKAPRMERHPTMGDIFVVYGMHPHAIAGGVLSLHRKHKHVIRRSSLLTIRVDGQRSPRMQRCGWTRQCCVWSAWELAVYVSILELSLQQGGQTQIFPSGHVTGNLLIEEGEVRIMRKPLVEQA